MGDAADLSGAYMPLLELEAVAAGTWFLNVVSVHPEFRGQGLGSILLSKAEEIACAAGAAQMSIIVEDANRGALKLYLRMVFSNGPAAPMCRFRVPWTRVTGSYSRSK
jgi:ribosomal protein S18 acetylase RimI-like enzyme